MVHCLRKDLQNLHHHGVFEERIGFLQAASGYDGDNRGDGLPHAGGLLVEDPELEDLEEGGEGDAGGGGGDVIALDDVEERGEVNEGVDRSPFLLGVEDEGAEGLEGLDERAVDGVIRGG